MPLRCRCRQLDSTSRFGRDNVEVKANVEKALGFANTDAVAEIDSKIVSLQKDLLKRIKQRQNCDSLGQEITELHEKKYQLQLEDAQRDGVRQSISELKAFFDEQETRIAEYDESLVRRLIEHITVYDDHFIVEFKSGVEVEVNGAHSFSSEDACSVPTEV